MLRCDCSAQKYVARVTLCNRSAQKMVVKATLRCGDCFAQEMDGSAQKMVVESW